MAETFDDFQFHHPIGQKSQRPAHAPLGWRPATLGDQARLRGPIELAPVAALAPGPPERNLQALLGQIAPGAFDARDAGVGVLGDEAIGERTSLALLIAEQEDARPALLLGAAGILAQQAFEQRAFFRGEMNAVFLRHPPLVFIDFLGYRTIFAAHPSQNL